MSVEELRAAALALPADERRELAELLWDSVGDDGLPPMPDWMFEECERRRKNLEARPETGLTWEDVERHIRERYGS